MELTRRFVFHGHATALSGHIFRTPAGESHRFIDGGCASSLTVVGGRSHGEAKGFHFGDFLSFGTAMTNAEGLFDDPHLATELTHGRGREEDLTTTTTVTVQLTDFKIGQKPTLSVELVRTAIISRSPRADGEPSIQVLDSALSGISIGGRKLVVILDEDLFRQYDTQSKLVAGMAHQEFVDAHATQLFLRTPIAGAPPPARARLVTGRETIHGTLVKDIHWADPDDPFPGAEIDHHSVFIPNIGRVFFAEIFVTRGSRRLLMMRFQLGSDTGGSAGAGCVTSNGDFAM